MSTPPQYPARVVIVGLGFAGFHAAKQLCRLLPPGDVEITLVTPQDYLLYSPLLPEVATGLVDPRHLAVSLRQALPGTRLVLGRATGVDRESRTVTVRSVEGDESVLGYDRLVLVPGGVSRQFDIPGVAEHAHGFKTLIEVVYLRDHVLRQLELAEHARDEVERRERLTVVAVGAGYTGTETVAQMQHRFAQIARSWTRVDPAEIRWVLVDLATTVLPELGPRLSRAALEVLQRRGIDLRLGVSVAKATAHEVTLTDGSVIPTRTLIWGAGVAASPLIETLGLPTAKGRLVVDTHLQVPGDPDVWAAGDAAAAPDLTQPHTQDGVHPATGMTAQHAQRQGVTLARNVASSLGTGTAIPYKHHDLGLVADLGGRDAVARPLGLPLTGLPAKLAAKGYHLLALPTMANRARVASDWLIDAVWGPQMSQLSAVRSEDALMSSPGVAGVPPASQGDALPTGTAG